MIKPVAGEETGPLLEAKTANFRYLSHWYIIYPIRPSGADCNIGPPEISKKTQSALLCQELEFQHVFLDVVLHEMFNDQTYPHAEFVKDCLRKNVDISRELKINLFERKINEGIKEGKKWSLVHGFPESMQKVHEFEEKVVLAATKKLLLTLSRCKKQTILCFSVAQLRGCSIV